MIFTILFLLLKKKGDVPPLNPYEDKKSHVWVDNDIFYSVPVDCRHLYKHIGGDITARKAANHELKNLALYNRAEIRGWN